MLNQTETHWLTHAHTRDVALGERLREDIAAVVIEVAESKSAGVHMATVTRLRERYGENARAVAEWGTSLAKAAGRRPCDAKIPDAFVQGSHRTGGGVDSATQTPAQQGVTALRGRDTKNLTDTNDGGTDPAVEIGGHAVSDVEVEPSISAVPHEPPQCGSLHRQAALPLWLCDAESVQQATPWLVAQHRAARLAELGVECAHDVTCAMGTEVAALQQAGIRTLGSDIDSARVTMAAHNCAQMQQFTGTPALIARADALAPISRAQVILADPARRAGGRRITSMDDTIPPLPDLTATWVSRGADMIIKCAPGVDYSTWQGEAHVVSVAGAVKETALWTPGLTQDGITRRATLISADGTITEFTDALPADLPEPSPGSYIVEPDGAIVRAGLVTQAAAAWRMRLLDPHLAFMTGDIAPIGVPSCEVWEQCTLKQLPSAVRAQCMSRGVAAIPAIEVLVRGAQVDPDILRTKIVAGLKKKLGRHGKSSGNAHVAGRGSMAGHSSSGAALLFGDSSAGAVDRTITDAPVTALTIVVARVGEGKSARVTAFVCGPRVIHSVHCPASHGTD